MKIITIKKGTWIDGVPDGLEIPCVMCGEKIFFDYVLKDSFWDKIVPEEFKLGVLCLPCLDKFVKKGRMHLSDDLIKVWFTGLNETIELRALNSFHY